MRFAPSETLHDLLFLSRCHPAMKQLASERMQAFTPQIVFGGGSFGVQLLAFINQRVDYIKLTCLLQFRSQKPEHLPQCGRIAHRSDNFPTVPWHLIDCGYIEIAV